jgi:hypothetical protein
MIFIIWFFIVVPKFEIVWMDVIAQPNVKYVLPYIYKKMGEDVNKQLKPINLPIIREIRWFGAQTVKFVKYYA